jgi:AcrR family transcriptional regulator
VNDAERERRGRGRPSTIDIGDLVRAAVTVIDRVGLDGCTIRAVAAEAGVAPMTLYRHVADKEQLLGLLPDALMALVAEEVRRRREPIRALLAIADGLADVLIAHPGIAPLFAHPEIGPNMQGTADYCIALWASVGVSPDDAFALVRAVVAQVIGEVITGHGGFDRTGVDLLLAAAQQRAVASPSTKLKDRTLKPHRE